MRKLVVAAVAALAFLAPSSARAIGFLGARVGYAMPSGNLEQGAAMKDSISSNVPVQIDAGLSMLNILSVGAYGSYGPTQVKSACTSCTGSEIRAGLQLNLRPPLVLKSLWGGVFAGWQQQSLKKTGLFDVKYSGWETGLQAGWDFSLLPLISFGPFASYSIAQFTSVSGAALGTKAQHQQLTLGIRALFDL
jgi:hypothetical protein